MDGNKYELLIVDDEPDIVAILEEILARDCNVTSARNGLEALEKIRDQNPTTPFDAILCDVQMPRMTGLALLETIRAKGLIVPVVFLSAHGEKDNIIRALQLGAVDFIDKPFCIEEVRKRLAPIFLLGQKFNRLISTSLEASRIRSPNELAIKDEATAQILELLRARFSTLVIAEGNAQQLPLKLRAGTERQL